MATASKNLFSIYCWLYGFRSHVSYDCRETFNCIRCTAEIICILWLHTIMTRTVGFPQYNLHRQERKATFVLFLIIYILGGLRIWGFGFPGPRVTYSFWLPDWVLGTKLQAFVRTVCLLTLETPAHPWETLFLCNKIGERTTAIS